MVVPLLGYAVDDEPGVVCKYENAGPTLEEILARDKKDALRRYVTENTADIVETIRARFDILWKVHIAHRCINAAAVRIDPVTHNVRVCNFEHSTMDEGSFDEREDLHVFLRHVEDSL